MSVQNEDALKKHLDLCSDDGSLIGRRTYHNNRYLKFDKFHYENRVTFIMANDFECMMVKGKHIPTACGLYVKSDYPDIIENGYEFIC